MAGSPPRANAQLESPSRKCTALQDKTHSGPPGPKLPEAQQKEEDARAEVRDILKCIRQQISCPPPIDRSLHQRARHAPPSSHTFPGLHGKKQMGQDESAGLGEIKEEPRAKAGGRLGLADIAKLKAKANLLRRKSHATAFGGPDLPRDLPTRIATFPDGLPKLGIGAADAKLVGAERSEFGSKGSASDKSGANRPATMPTLPDFNFSVTSLNPSPGASAQTSAVPSAMNSDDDGFSDDEDVEKEAFRKDRNLKTLNESRKVPYDEIMAALPEVFKSTAASAARQTDSPFSSALPLPRKLSTSSLHETSDMLHAEGIQKLRHHDWQGACRDFEAAWDRLEQEVEQANEDESRIKGLARAKRLTKCRIRFQPSRANLSDIGGLSDSDSLEESDEEHDEEVADPGIHLRPNRTGNSQQQALKKAAALAKRMKMENAFRKALGLDLTLVYARLQEWSKADQCTGAVLGSFWPAGQLPDFDNHDDAEMWAQLMVRRGVACTYMGAEHYSRAQDYFLDVMKELPRHRDAKHGLQCVRFLMSQAKPNLPS